ncbi:MAG: glycosyl hydrolase family 28-related protein [Candidatus Methylacidiphilales bacterium]|nr:glycosyl hydrolase family 28-related protein [Candidatus Methylacidiphilales bacterium]
MIKWLILLPVLWLHVSGGAAAADQTSALWGVSGELWSPASRLPDFSLAGYACGREPIPDYPVLTSVKEHGAKGDGSSDDTAAFQRALHAVGERGAVWVPEGRYVITDVVEIHRSRVVLRGEGPDKSVLVMPKPLSEIRPRANVDAVKAAYSFTGGFVTMQGTDKGQRLSEVVAPSKRGDSLLYLASTDTLKVGDWIRLVMQDPPDHSLLRHLHGNLLEPGTDTPNLKTPVDWAAQVKAVDGQKITLDRPLRVDVRLEWKPEVLALAPTLRGSGLENIGFEFPGVPKRPHLQEEGYNAVHIKGAVDCWIRNVTVTDADNGVIMGGSRFCTVDGFTTRALKRTGLTGHHALWATSRTQDALFHGFRFETTYVHDLTVEGYANGNVFTKGSGVAINCDHHRNAPYENLFTDFDAGDPRRLFESSGRLDRGPHSGARTTFWAIRGQGNFPKIPPTQDWPLINVVGFGNFTPAQDPDGPWVEPGDTEFKPVNLWESQAAYRRSLK